MKGLEWRDSFVRWNDGVKYCIISVANALLNGECVASFLGVLHPSTVVMD